MPTPTTRLEAPWRTGDTGGGMSTQRTSRGGSEIDWDDSTRILRVRVGRAGDSLRLMADDAAWMIDHIRQWAGEERFGYLADCIGAGMADAGFRVAMGDFFRARKKGSLCIAWYHINPLTRIVIEMFALVTLGSDAKTFSNEAAARNWLRERGFG